MNELFLNKKNGVKMPVLFIGHGSPMNAIADNKFTHTLQGIGQNLPRPRAILCISAHWMTRGTQVTKMQHPKTIHDFGGFPKALFDINYPAPGSPEIGSLVQETIQSVSVSADENTWGLDHGTWSVLKHMYPSADIPVLQLSLDMHEGPGFHFKLGQELQVLRERGILIIGSGNMVHNLRQISWETNATPYAWATEFDEWMKDKLLKKDFKAIQDDFLKTEAGKLSNPTLDHYYPLLYTLGASTNKDVLKFEYEEMQNASISMRSVSLT